MPSPLLYTVYSLTKTVNYLGCLNYRELDLQLFLQIFNLLISLREEVLLTHTLLTSDKYIHALCS